MVDPTKPKPHNLQPQSPCTPEARQGELLDWLSGLVPLRPAGFWCRVSDTPGNFEFRAARFVVGGSRYTYLDDRSSSLT